MVCLCQGDCWVYEKVVNVSIESQAWCNDPAVAKAVKHCDLIEDRSGWLVDHAVVGGQVRERPSAADTAA